MKKIYLQLLFFVTAGFSSVDCQNIVLKPSELFGTWKATDKTGYNTYLLLKKDF